jgi:hypothetical protein
MPDLVVIRSKNCFWRGVSTVKVISRSGDIPDIKRGMPIARALRKLLQEGFEISFGSGDAKGFSYTLIRRERPVPGPYDYFMERLGQTLTIETIAGTVAGKLVFVGEDFIQLHEASGDVALIPFASIVATS